MAIKVIDRLILVVYTGEPIDEEWVDYLQVVKHHGVTRTMQIVVTDGGGPTSPQRRALRELLAHYPHPAPVAVVSGNVAVRAMVTVMSWFNRWLMAFPPSGMSDALAFLDIPESRRDLIEREIASLRLRLTLSSVEGAS